MRRARRVIFLFKVLFFLTVSGGCTLLVEERLDQEPKVHCAEHNLRLTRELELPRCATVVGERFTIRLEDFAPDDTAVVSFAPADAPQAVLRAVEVPVVAPGTATFAFPELLVAPSTRIRVQIHGKNALNAFSGHFEIDLLSTIAALDDGTVTLLFWDGRSRPQRHGTVPGNSWPSPSPELRLSPCGRFLASGPRTVYFNGEPRFSPGTAPVDLDLRTLFERKPLWPFLTNTGGIDSLGFLSSEDPLIARPVWGRFDAQFQRWRLSVSTFKLESPVLTVDVTQVPDFALPPRLVEAFGSVLALSRDHLANWQYGESAAASEAFLLITPELESRTLTCAELFGSDAVAMVPVEALPVEHPERGKTALFSCAEADLAGRDPGFRVSWRWIPWEREGPRLDSAGPVFSVLTDSPPLGWTLPAAPAPDAPQLLTGLCPETGGPCGPVLVDPRETAPIAIDVSPFEGRGFAALFVDRDTLLLYVPTDWTHDAYGAGASPVQVIGSRATGAWHFTPHTRDLNHALVWSGGLLLLANTTQLIQSTLSDFTAGLPGELIAPSSCGFIALKPSYR